MNHLRNLGILFLFFNPIFGFSQNLQNLDLKYGFNKFKLESSIQNYSNDLVYISVDKVSGVKFYSYTKKDISVFGFKDVKQIWLGFYKDKLYNIDVVLNGGDTMYSTIVPKLIELFGTPTYFNEGSEYFGEQDVKTYMEDPRQWVTLKTLLGINKVKCNSPSRPCTINIFLVSQKLKKEINNDGF